MRVLIGVIALSLFACFTGTADVRLTPQPEIVSMKAENGPLTIDALIELALRVSDASSTSIDRWKRTLESWQDEVLTQVESGWSDSKKGEAVLAFLHSHLKAYEHHQTRVDVLLETGKFNCVSSAVVYMILGRTVGLDVQAVSTKDHAFCIVYASDKNIDVETTTRYGFDPGSKTEFTNSFGATGFVYTPPGNYRDRQTINDRQLLGLLIQNRMADFQRIGKNAELVGLGIDRWTLEKTPEAFKTLVNGFVSYGAELNQKKDYQRGLELLEPMTQWTGNVPEVQSLAATFLNNQINELLDRADYSGAQALATLWKNKGYYTTKQWQDTISVILGSELSWAVRNLSTTQAAEKIEAAYAVQGVSASRRTELLVYVHLNEVQKIASQKGAKAAWAYIDSLSEELKTSKDVKEARNVYTYNWSVEIHNQFVKLFNSGKKAEAKKWIQDALAELPTSELLKNDWAALTRR